MVVEFCNFQWLQRSFGFFFFFFFFKFIMGFGGWHGGGGYLWLWWLIWVRGGRWVCWDVSGGGGVLL